MTDTCRICAKQFHSPEALAQHHKSAHAHRPETATKRPVKKYLAGAALVVILFLLGYGATVLIAPASNADIAFAQCIADSGAKFYGAFWCSHCQDQKNIFGKAASYLPYIECSNQDRSQKKVCSDVGIEGYPTWVFPDGSRDFVMTKLDLSRKTGCPLPST